MEVNAYQAGNTVRLEGSFTDFHGIPVDPSIVRVRLYDQQHNQISDTIINTTLNRDDVGVYFYYYTAPMEYVNHKIIYEWYAEVNGIPVIKRNSFKIKFM